MQPSTLSLQSKNLRFGAVAPAVSPDYGKNSNAYIWSTSDSYFIHEQKHAGWREMIAEICDRLKVLKKDGQPLNVLEFGPGAGNSTVALVENAPDIQLTAVELDPAYHKTLAKNTKKFTNVTAELGNGLTYKPKEKKDIVIWNFSFTHLQAPDRAKFLKHCKDNLLAKGGTLFIADEFLPAGYSEKKGLLMHHGNVIYHALRHGNFQTANLEFQALVSGWRKKADFKTSTAAFGKELQLAGFTFHKTRIYPHSKDSALFRNNTGGVYVYEAQLRDAHIQRSKTYEPFIMSLPDTPGQRDPFRLILRSFNPANEEQQRDLQWAENVEKALAQVVSKISSREISGYQPAMQTLIEGYQEAYREKFKYSPELLPRVKKFGKQREFYPPRSFDVWDGFGDYYHNQANRVLPEALGTVVFEYTLPTGEKLPMSSIFEIRSMGGYDTHIQARDARNFEPIHQEQERLFQEILKLRDVANTKQKLDQAVKLVATYHWLSCQTMEYERGAAGLTDAMSKVMFDTLGIATTRCKEGLRLDMEAMTRDLNGFVENYTSFFEHPPAYS